MQSFLERFDRLAGIEAAKPVSGWLERISFFFLILTILCAPHSIAATQSAWLIGMFAWMLRVVFVKPRPRLARTPLGVALWGLFGWSALSSVLSYAPDISLDKLRNAALFLIFYFVVNLVKTKRAAVFLAKALIFSTMFVVVWTPIERLIGRGVEVSGVTKESPLTKARMFDGDTLLEAQGVKIRLPEDLAAALEANETVKLKAFRLDYEFEVELKRSDLLPGASASEKLGIGGWKRSRSWRSAGFYSHYTSFAEVLQLVASLTLGILISLLSVRKSKFVETGGAGSQSRFAALKGRLLQPRTVLLAVCLAATLLALLLTVTRAAQLAFLLSVLVVGVLSGSRKTIWWTAVIVLPLALAGLLLLQQTRSVGFFDLKDNSTQWRLTVYREGWNLATANARHLLIGVGMDSIRRYAGEWGLFDNGKLPMGHFHSTPLQLIVERGFPALFFWLWGMWIYGRALLRRLKVQRQKGDESSLVEKGIVLGAFGGLIGFLTSSLVHYNYGAAVVAMMFFIIMGLSMRIALEPESPES